VVQAAYATLVALYPALKTTLFDPQRATSLAAISSDVAAENSFSIAHGVQWGQTVADAILSWRSSDGFTPPPPPFTGGNAVGEWRPTPPGFLPGAGPQFANMTPWVISSPSAFRPGGPPALTSSQYAADVNETKSMGSNSSATRTTDQTTFAVFWNTSTASFFWNTVAVLLGAEHHTTLSDNARLLALLNTAMADAAIACWEAKYHYVAWRPITAIRLADTDGNPATDPDPAWTPLLTTPNHPEYPSGHSSVSGAAAAVLSDYFGENSAFSIYSDAAGEEGVVRSFSSFSTALEEIKNARVYGGIHFRSACNDAQTMGIAIA
jgi:membrane-associated phospholipid phosphatase